MITKRFEVTVIDPITTAELEWFELNITREGMDCALTSNGRILMVDGCETIHELISVLAEHEFVHDIGLIREVVEYEPQYDDDDTRYLIQFEE